MSVKVSHNLNPVELEETLEKALKNVKKNREEPKQFFPDKLSESIRKDSNEVFDRVLNNMMKEINDVISEK